MLCDTTQQQCLYIMLLGPQQGTTTSDMQSSVSARWMDTLHACCSAAHSCRKQV